MYLYTYTYFIIVLTASLGIDDLKCLRLSVAETLSV